MALNPTHFTMAASGRVQRARYLTRVQRTRGAATQRAASAAQTKGHWRADARLLGGRGRSDSVATPGHGEKRKVGR
jgi:hypothetical protein